MPATQVHEIICISFYDKNKKIGLRLTYPDIRLENGTVHQAKIKATCFMKEYGLNPIGNWQYNGFTNDFYREFESDTGRRKKRAFIHLFE